MGKMCVSETAHCFTRTIQKKHIGFPSISKSRLIRVAFIRGVEAQNKRW